MTKSVFRGNLAALILLLNMVLFDVYSGPVLSLLPNNILVLSIAEELILFLPPIAIYYLMSSKGTGFWADSFNIKELSVVNILLIVLMSILIQPALMSVSAITSLFFPNAASEYLESMANMPAFATLVMTSLLPALFEELYFRGIVFSNFKSIHPLKACILGGLLFGMAHLNFQQFSYAFLMGCVFCYFVYKTGSVFSSILSHFLINGTQTILSSLSLKVTSSQAAAQTAAQTVQTTQNTLQSLMPFFYLTLLSIIPLLFAFYMFSLYNDRFNPINRQQNSDTAYMAKQRIISWPFIIFVIIFIYYCLPA